MRYPFVIVHIVLGIAFLIEMFYVSYHLFAKHEYTQLKHRLAVICIYVSSLIVYLGYIPLALSGEERSCIAVLGAFVLMQSIQTQMKKSTTTH